MGNQPKHNITMTHRHHSMLLSGRGNLHVAEYLIKEFPGVVTCTDAPVDRDGNTALHVAVKHGSVIKYLIRNVKSVLARHC